MPDFTIGEVAIQADCRLSGMVRCGAERPAGVAAFAAVASVDADSPPEVGPRGMFRAVFLFRGRQLPRHVPSRPGAPGGRAALRPLVETGARGRPEAGGRAAIGESRAVFFRSGGCCGQTKRFLARLTKPLMLCGADLPYGLYGLRRRALPQP
ncbi:hypothetical protein CV_3319 [Chromobacterium violaceum ATCC 12472]|uniref:Uncharacterized protein n=1 Tax=Chromobacterium violaceum (strain ATCC 12472 / DSM 30191 / JCM 1249 / CCUG 213 / NBRC 12614 / NCIMB 9131 / NCTC 9757 / MK) TaxID=243365 RepID=Q7NSV0_CHRVO|nr:hypothetical protein CV_3319 [Chromobacterium violaceum ATCC 12472]